MTPADLLIEHADLIATCAGPAPRRGGAQNDVSPAASAVVAAHRGTIVYVGAAAALHDHVRLEPDTVRLDVRGCTVVPGFVDPHTHVLFAGDRLDEVRQRLSGATYAEVAAAGGGIRRTVAATRQASDDDLAAAARERLDGMLACGTTTAEVKSGYGLTLDAELRLLRVIKRLQAEHAVDLIPTFLGAHDIPEELRDAPDDYVSLVTEKMLPAVAREALAEWCDVFCEEGAFTPAQSLAILRAAAAAGLKPRVHANELASSGGVQVAVQVGARSADHLLFVDQKEVDLLATASTCAVLLPIAAFYLTLGRFAPARTLIDRGVPVALATDINPGAGLSPSMPFAMALACFLMNMTFEEALVAATLNAAWSLDRAHVVGSLEPGKLMDAVVVTGSAMNLLRVGAPSIAMVIKRGQVILSR